MKSLRVGGGLWITLLSALPAHAEPPDFVRSDVRGGFEQPFTEGKKERVGEYLLLEPRPRLEVDISALRGDAYVDFITDFRHEKDFDGAVRVDLWRLLRVDLSYDRLPHRLQRDTLANLGFTEDATLDLREVFTERQLAIERTELRPALTINLPEIAELRQATISARYRYLLRDGHEQVQTIAHCPSCHVHSTHRPVDQRTDEFEIGLEGTVARSVSLSYRHLLRAFDERSPPPEFDYPRPPDLGEGFIPISGVLPFAAIPDTTKNNDRITLAWSGPRRIRAAAVYSFTTAQNDESGVATDSHLFGLKLTAPIVDSLRAKGSYRFVEIDPKIESSLRRTGHCAGFDLVFSPMRQAQIEAGYQLESLSRDGVLVGRTAIEGPAMDGAIFSEQRSSETMSRHTMRARITARPLLGLEASLRYRLLLTGNPLRTIGRQGSFAPASGTAPTPNVEGIYPTLTGLSEQAHELRASLRWRPSALLTLSPSYSARIATGIHAFEDDPDPLNDAVDHLLNMTAMLAPSSWLHFDLSYYFRRDQTRTDLYYGQVGGLREAGEGWVDVSEDAIYRGLSHTAVASAGYSPIDAVWLTAAGQVSRGEAQFSGDALSTEVGSLSALAIETVGAYAGAEWRFLPRWLAGAQLRVDQFVQRPDRIYDGRRQLVWVYLRWREQLP